MAEQKKSWFESMAGIVPGSLCIPEQRTSVEDSATPFPDSTKHLSKRIRTMTNAFNVERAVADGRLQRMAGWIMHDGYYPQPSETMDIAETLAQIGDDYSMDPIQVNLAYEIALLETGIRKRGTEHGEA